MIPRSALMFLLVPALLWAKPAQEDDGRLHAILTSRPRGFVEKRSLVREAIDYGKTLQLQGREQSALALYTKALEFWPNHPEAYPLYRELRSRANLREDTKPAQDSIPPVAPETSPAKETKQDRPPRRAAPSDVTRRHTSAKAPIVNSPVVQGPGALPPSNQQGGLPEWFLYAIGLGAGFLGLLLGIAFLMAYVAGARSKVANSRIGGEPQASAWKPIARIHDAVLAPGAQYEDISASIPDLDKGTRLMILEKMEDLAKRTRQDVSPQAIMELAMPLLTDGDDFIRDRVQVLLKAGLAGYLDSVAEAHPAALIQNRHPLSLPDSIGPMARFVDRKTNRENHSETARKAGEQIAAAMGMTSDEIAEIGLAAAMMDLGMLGIPETIFRSKTKLDPGETATMQTHPEKTLEMVQFAGFSPTIMDAIRSHHERWDGSGYPAGLSQEAIPLAARILAVADTYAALVSYRPHRTTFSHENAVKFIKGEAGRLFDPGVVNVFTSVYADESKQAG